MKGIREDLDSILSRALGQVDASSTSKNKYRSAVTILESELDLCGLLIKSLGAPKNYGNRVSEATGTDAKVLIVIGNEDVDQEALRRAYLSRAVRFVPTLLVVRDGGECIAVEVITEGDNPFPGVDVQHVSPVQGPAPNVPGLVASLLSLDGRPWDVVQPAIEDLKDKWRKSLLVKQAPDQKNLMNRIREAAGRRPSVLAVVTTQDLRASCGQALLEITDLVGEAVVVTDGRERVHVEIAETAAGALFDAGTFDDEADDFVAWNAVLLRDFFSPSYANEEVTLAVAPSVLDDIAPELGGFEGLLEAVRQGPPWQVESGQDLAKTALGLRAQRKYRERRPPSYVHPTRHIPYGTASDKFPSYLPILAALVALAVEYDSKGFYLHARQRLALGPNWGANELESINKLWGDLESWTEKTKGRFGVFRRRTLGGFPHIGMLKAQSILRSSDIGKLHELFAKLGLRPGAHAPRNEVSDFLSRIREEPTLSQGLRDAANQADYRDALVERLDLILLAWDGSTTSTVDGMGSPTTAREYAKLGIALLADRGHPPFRLGWRVPPLRDDGRVTLEHGGGSTWSAIFDGGPYTVARSSALHNGSELLDSEVTLSICHEDDLRPPARLKNLTRSPANLNILGYCRRHRCLVELDSLPGYGATYILVSPGNSNFDHWVDFERVELRTCPSQGLPEGWRLFYLEDASSLTADQRCRLPGIRDDSPLPRAIRLTGGLRILRAGRVAYLPHDLPMVEVDAPRDAVIASPGLCLAEVGATEDSVDSEFLEGAIDSARRTFEVLVENSDLMLFVLTVTSSTGKTLGTAKLRLAFGASNRSDGKIDLVPVCRSTLGEVAVRGMVATPSPANTVPTLVDVPLSRLGDTFAAMPWQLPHECAEGRFLDALAQGSRRMSYGRARNILRRYLEHEPRRTTSATFEALRQRGLLEIQMDSRGRWTAVGAVKPTLYALPISADGERVWGVCGSPTIDQWGELSATGAELYVSRHPMTSLPVFRLRGQIIAPGTFAVSTQSPTAIAECSSSLETIGQTLASRGFESLDKRADDREWFQAQSADWTGAVPPGHFDWALVRYTDPETGSHRLHALRSGTDNEYLYRHVRNERWATWVAYDSCVRHFETLVPGVAPWPLSYNPMTRSLWVPARMRLPLILERALVACSGAPPARVRLQRDPKPSISDGSSIRALTDIGVFIGAFDRNYDEFLPAKDLRWWLEYQYVPPPLVGVVASRLGCRIDNIGELK